MMRTPTLEAAKLVFQRDMTLAWRRWDEVMQPLIFYVVVTTMFPLATTPDRSALRVISGGGVWVAALLASLLALEALFRADVEKILDELDAALDQRVFETRTGAHELRVLLVGAESHDPLDTRPVVPAAIEQDDLAR